jgi:hypothetical protein
MSVAALTDIRRPTGERIVAPTDSIWDWRNSMEVKRSVHRLSWIAVIVLLGLVGSYAGAAAQASKLTDAQFKSLANTAKTADDHKKLAEYYRAHAAEHEADAKLHAQIVDTSRKNPTDNQAWELGRAADHYAEHSKEAAEALRELATLHEGMSQRSKS